MSENKKDNLSFMLLVIFLISVIMCIASFGVITWARYRSIIDGNVEAQIAKWSFKVNGEEEVFANIDLADTIAFSHVEDKKIAPGTEGSINLEIDARGTEVSLMYTITLSDLTNKPQNLKFYSDENYTNEIQAEQDGSYVIKDKMLLADNNMLKNEKIYWKWDYITGSSDNEIRANNVQDTLDAGKEVTAKIKVKGIQINSDNDDLNNGGNSGNSGDSGDSGDNGNSGSQGGNSGSGDDSGSGSGSGSDTPTPVEEKEYYQEADVIEIPFEISDENFASVYKLASRNNLIMYADNPINISAEDIKVIVGGNEIQFEQKTLQYLGHSGGMYKFKLIVCKAEVVGKIELRVVKNNIDERITTNKYIDAFAPEIVTTPSTTNIGESNRITISVNEEYPAEENVYEYCISASNSSFDEEAEWKTYSNGSSYNIDNAGNETVYMWFKQIKDLAGNESEYTRTINGENYIVKGPYKFDIVKPVIKSGGFIEMISSDSTGKVYDIPIEVVDEGGYQESSTPNNLRASEIDVYIDNSEYTPVEKSLTYTTRQDGRHIYILRVKLATWGRLDLKFDEGVIRDNVNLTNIQTEFEVIDIYADMRGDGTEQSPYIVYTVEHLNQIKSKLDKWYRLGRDISLEEIDNWEPIGNSSNPFLGGFDGDGYTISNLTINENADYKGLFGKNTGTIKNLKLDEVDITGRNEVGALCGFNTGTIQNIDVTNELVQGVSKLGGVIGENSGNVSGVSVVSNVIGINNGSSIGGLIGYYGDGYVYRCYSTGSVQGYNFVGGVIGQGYNNKIIEESYSTATVIGLHESAGGLVGDAYITIINCYSTGSVTGDYYVGSLIGWISTGYISNSYAIGEVTGNRNIGGLIGGYRGEKDVRNSYWVPELVNQYESDGGFSNCAATMIYGAAYDNWDFTDVWKIDEGQSFAYLKNLPKPQGVSISNIQNIVMFDGGNGTANNPFLISNVQQLKLMASSPNACYRLTSNISLPQNWVPIGTESRKFAGVFDGGNYTISNLSIDSSEDNIGFFAFNSGEIRNVKFISVDVKGDEMVGAVVGTNSGIVRNVELISGEVNGYACIGGIAGKNTGTITRCSSSIDVTGSDASVGGIVGRNALASVLKCISSGNIKGYCYVGGIIGENFRDDSSNNSIVSECFSSANVEATDRTAGGIAGDAYVQIINCYSTGIIKAPSKAGGITGWCNGTIVNCYTTSKIEGSGEPILGTIGSGKITSTYWNRTYSGRESSSYGTEANLSDINTYVDWDFEDIWEFSGGLPVLRCFNSLSNVASVGVLNNVRERFLETRYLCY